jgi:hypothetical protein
VGVNDMADIPATPASDRRGKAQQKRNLAGTELNLAGMSSVYRLPIARISLGRPTTRLLLNLFASRELNGGFT